MNNSLIKVARKVLDPLWIKASLRGSASWGPKKGNNPYSGTNLTMVIGKEAVFVSEGPQGKSIIHQFREADNTVLGRRVGEILTKAGLPFIKTEAWPAKTLEMIVKKVLPFSDCLWYCPKCKQGGAIDITSDSEHQEALKKAYLKHEEVSPDCEAAKVKIYQMIDNRLTELKDLSQIVSAKRAP